MELTVKCGSCDVELDAVLDRSNHLIVESCQGCVKEAERKNFDEGYYAGHSAGYEEAMAK